MSGLYFLCNLEERKMLPTNWDRKVQEIANTKSHLVHMDGQHPTSREPRNTSGSDVFVVHGETVMHELPWLFELYANDFLRIADLEFENQFEISDDIASSININYLKGKGARYEWHVDSNPMTGLLFVTFHRKGDGGELVLNVNQSKTVVYPKRGDFLLFDAREIPHCVAPLVTSPYRISIPMNYYLKGRQQDYPEDLNSYLFGK